MSFMPFMFVLNEISDSDAFFAPGSPAPAARLMLPLRQLPSLSRISSQQGELDRW